MTNGERVFACPRFLTAVPHLWFPPQAMFTYNNPYSGPTSIGRPNHRSQVH